MTAPAGTRERVLEVARGEFGTVESPAGSNRQKYGAFYGMNGVAWCMEFVWYVLVQAGVKMPPPIKTAYTPTSAAAFKNAGRWLSNTSKAVQPGDVVHFYWPNMGRIAHVGIVEEVRADGTLVCIEGNTSEAGGRTGGRVMRQVRSRATIHPNGGFGQPEYAEQEELTMGQFEKLMDGLFSTSKNKAKDASRRGQSLMDETEDAKNAAGRAEKAAVRAAEAAEESAATAKRIEEALAKG